MPNTTTNKFTFNPEKFIKASLRSWRVYAASVLCFVVLMVAMSILRPSREEVLAQIMLKDEAASGSMMLAGQLARSFSLGDMLGGSSTTDNETYVLQSHTVFLQTVRQMGLNTTYFARPFGILSRQEISNAPYRLTYPAGISDTLSTVLVFDIKGSGDKYDVRLKAQRKVVSETKDASMPMSLSTPYGEFVIDKTEHYSPESTGKKYRITLTSYDAAACTYAKLVKIYVPDRKSDFIDLSYVTDDTAFGKSLLTHVIDNYLNIYNIYKYDRNLETMRMVDERLESLSNELLESENALEKFKQSHKLTDVEADAAYLMNKTGEIESRVLEAQTNYEVVKLTRDFLKNPENNYSLIPDLFMSASGSTDNGGLIKQYNELILQRMQLTSTAKSGNSSVKLLDEQIDALRANILTSVDRMYQNASVTLRDLKNEDNLNRTRLGSLPAIERQYLVLKRDNMLQEQIYLFLLQQREELNMTLDSKTLPAQVIDQPYVLPGPVGMSRKFAIAVGIFLGLVAAAAYVFFTKLRSFPITSVKDLDANLEVPALTSLSADKANTGISALAAGAPNAESLRLLRSDIESALRECSGKVTAVTALRDTESKTYVAVNLAATLALTGKRVALVDATLRDAQVARVLGLRAESSVADFVHGHGTGIATQSAPAGQHCTLDVVTSAGTAADASDIVASVRFAELVNILRLNYEYVVIDASQIAGYSDIYDITELADITAVVCSAGKVNEDDLSQLNTLYTDRRLKRMAVVKYGFN